MTALTWCPQLPPQVLDFRWIMILSLLTCVSHSDTNCFCLQSGAAKQCSRKKQNKQKQPHLMRDTRARRAACLLSLQPPPQQSPWTCYDLLWPSLFIQKAAECILWPDVRPHTQRSWAQFINPMLPVLTASSLLTNVSLDQCSLTQFQGREVTGHLLNDTRSMKCHHPQTKKVDRPAAQVLFLFPRQHRADEVSLFCH